MDAITLAVPTRDLSRKPRDLRLARLIPAEIYGPAVASNQHVQIAYQDFLRAYRRAGTSAVVTLQLGDQSLPVLIHRVDWHPVTDECIHAEFLAIDLTRPVTTDVPLRFVGQAPAVKQLSGIITTTKSEVSVRALPDKLPHDFEVSLEGLESLHASLHVSDITAPQGVEILDDPSVVLVIIAAPKTKEQVEAELSTEVGDTVSSEQRVQADTAKEAAAASKASDTEKKGSE